MLIFIRDIQIYFLSIRSLFLTTGFRSVCLCCKRHHAKHKLLPACLTEKKCLSLFEISHGHTHKEETT